MKILSYSFFSLFLLFDILPKGSVCYKSIYLCKQIWVHTFFYFSFYTDGSMLYIIYIYIYIYLTNLLCPYPSNLG